MSAHEDPQASWFKDAVIYEVHVRAFHDADGDGIGDFRGLTSKLDYLHDLGVTAVWLLPFYPSPLKDDGYDISDYTSIHPSYGTLRDFRTFLREAHRRNIKVITELVLNHTSDQHPWFQRARRAPAGSSARDFYVWSDTPDKYPEVRIIFKDFEASNWTWDPVAKAYYWHRFYSHQPDLNFDNPAVRRAMLQVVDFWLEMGVDGLRLDAVPYLYEREGTNCENLAEGHDFLRHLRKHIDERFPNRMLLAEANQWPEDAVAYFGDGDECHMAFHFPLMPRMFMASRMEDRFPIIDILAQTPDIPEGAQWAMFLRNHDELTLEMVTDEERDYMYRVYAQDPQARINLGIRHRLAPLLGNDRRLIEMMNGLLFSMPGTPVLYYGDEIGMGDNIYLGDRNGVRTPMQWSADRNAGFSSANPQKLFLPVVIDPEYHAEAINVEAQQANPHSLLWWMKRIIALRKRYPAFGRGTLRMLYPENRKVLTYLRSAGDTHILVVANLSRHAQYVELDLSEFEGTVPVELFGGTEFPRIGELPYLLTLQPYAFSWFALEPAERETSAEEERPLPTLHATTWNALLSRETRQALEDLLPVWLAQRRWFGGKGRRIKSAHLEHAIAVPGRNSKAPAGYLTMARVEYAEGEGESYVLPLAISDPNPDQHPAHAIAMLQGAEGVRVLYDAMWSEEFQAALLDAIASRRRGPGEGIEMIASPTPVLRRLLAAADDLEASVIQAEQSNTSIVYGRKLILKLMRRPGEGLNPDLEIGRFLTERTSYGYVPRVAGAVELRRNREEPTTLGILQEYIQNEGDAWIYTLDQLGAFVERMAAHPGEGPPPTPSSSPLELAALETPPEAIEQIGTYLGQAALLGSRTAELHLALGSDADDPRFAPEAFTGLYQRSLYQSLRGQAGRLMEVVRAKRRAFPVLDQISGREEDIHARLRAVLDERIQAQRIRCHGDFHLGQVLYTGKDFVIIDFEGEPARPASERRIKRSPLTDVAGMLRSFHYAAHTALRTGGGGVRPEDREAVEPWVRFWYLWVSATYLREYLATAGDAPFIPRTPSTTAVLLDAYLMQKALYEVGYELNHRPDWVDLPVRGILDLLDGASA